MKSYYCLGKEYKDSILRQKLSLFFSVINTIHQSKSIASIILQHLYINFVREYQKLYSSYNLHSTNYVRKSYLELKREYAFVKEDENI